MIAPGRRMREGGCREPPHRRSPRSTPAWSITPPRAACIRGHYLRGWLALRVGSMSAGGTQGAARTSSTCVQDYVHGAQELEEVEMAEGLGKRKCTSRSVLCRAFILRPYPAKSPACRAFRAS